MTVLSAGHFSDSRDCRLSSAVEQRFCKPKVGGSIPSAGTISPAEPESNQSGPFWVLLAEFWYRVAALLRRWN